MTGLEIEYLAAPAVPAAAGAEYFSARKPADEYQLVRRRDVEGLAVHFLVFQLERFRNALGDRMRGIAAPDARAIALAPFQRSGRADQQLHRLARVRGMQPDESHALPNRVANAERDLVRHLIVRHVRPPDEHVGVVEHFLGKPAFGHFHGGDANGEILFLLEQCLQRVVQAVRVNFFDFTRGEFEKFAQLGVLEQRAVRRKGFDAAILNVFAPYGDFDHGITLLIVFFF